MIQAESCSGQAQDHDRQAAAYSAAFQFPNGIDETHDALKTDCFGQVVTECCQGDHRLNDHQAPDDGGKRVIINRFIKACGNRMI
jgi:hypothetical protein